MTSFSKQGLVGLNLLGLLAVSPATLADGKTFPHMTQKQANQLLNDIKKPIMSRKLNWDEIKEAGESRALVGYHNHEILCGRDELTYAEIESKVLKPFFNALINNKGKADKYISKGASFDKLSLQDNNSSVLTDFISKVDWHSQKKGTFKDLKNYKKQFKKIESFNIKGIQIIGNETRRDKKLNLLNPRITVRLDVRGIDKNNSLRQDISHVDIEVKRKGTSFEITDFTLLSGKTLLGQKKKFFSSKLQASVDSNVSHYTRREAIRRGGYAMAVGDYDNDGQKDIFVGHRENSELITIGKNGQITKKKPEGLVLDEFAKSAAFFDYDNDGLDDLLVVKFIPYSERGTNKKVLNVFKNLGNNKFKELAINKIESKHQLSYAMPAAIADFDKDGYLDFYVGYPGVKDFTYVGNVSPIKNVNGLYMNNKDGSFRDASKLFVKSKAQSNPDYLFPHSALAFDFDQDNDMDIVVIDDRANLSPFYANLGKKGFSAVNEEISFGNSGYGMGVDFGDFNNDGYLDIVLSYVESDSSERIDISCEKNWGFNYQAQRTKTLQILMNDKNGGYSQLNLRKAGIENVGAGLAGIRVFDYNNDGLDDIYVANGLWSGDENSSDMSPLFELAQKSGVVSKNSSIRFVNRESTQSMFMNVLAFFKGNVITGEKDNKSPSMSGFQRNRLYQNLGNNKFVDVAYHAGVDSIADGYMIATTDFDKDGKLDLVLRNCDKGIESKEFSSLEVFMNRTPSKNNSIAINLIGTRSNRNAIGATVEAVIDGKKVVKHVVALHGTVQSDRTVHLGLGKNAKAELITIKWPRGGKKVLRNVDAGHYDIEEDKNQLSSL